MATPRQGVWLQGLLVVIAYVIGFMHVHAQPVAAGPLPEDRLGVQAAGQGAAGVATIVSTLSGCMQVVHDNVPPYEVSTSSSSMMLVWDGTPSFAYLTLTSCGVKPGKNHSVFLNGHLVAQVRDDVYSTCLCGSSGQPTTYPLSNPGVVLKGWNVISITNDADLTDDWMGHSARITLEGNVRGTTITEFSYVSSADGSSRSAVYQLPIGYDPAVAIPLLVSVGGTGEDALQAVQRYAQRASDRGWLLLGPNLRRLRSSTGGRTASLTNQKDVMDAIAYMKANFNVDVDRIYMSGFSSGGGVAATIAAKYPHVFAAVMDWAGPTYLLEWDRQRGSLQENDIGCPYSGVGACPLEWDRRSPRSMAQNLRNVPLAVLHDPNDAAVPIQQARSFVQKMGEFYSPIEAYDKLYWEHQQGHASELPGWDALGWLFNYRRNANPTHIHIRTDESKDYYWLSVAQLFWGGSHVEGWSEAEVSYDLTTKVISATVWDERRLPTGGYAPVEITLDVAAMGFDPASIFTIEDHDLSSGEFVHWEQSPLAGRLTLTAVRDARGQVRHQYLIHTDRVSYHTLTYQQGVSPPGYAQTQDTYLRSEDGPGVYRGTGPDLMVNDDGRVVSLIKFDLTSIPPGAVIKQAVLNLHLLERGPSAVDLSVHRLIRHWQSAEATWQLATTLQPWAVPGASGANVDYDPTPIYEVAGAYHLGWHPFDLKDVVLQWVRSEAPNEGVLISGPRQGNETTFLRFSSAEAPIAGHRPYLQVVYALPSSIPTATVTPPAPTATPTRTATRTPTLTPTVTRTISATATPGTRWVVSLPMLYKWVP